MDVFVFAKLGCRVTLSGRRGAPMRMKGGITGRGIAKDVAAAARGGREGRWGRRSRDDGFLARGDGDCSDVVPGRGNP